MNRPKTASIEILSEIKNIKRVSSEILGSLLPYNVSEDRLFDIRLCAEEAVRNAIVHGNRSNAKARVRVYYRIENDRINIEVEDEGDGYDPDSIPDPTGDNDIMKESGRGVYLIRVLMDRVEFNKKGNKITMEKAL